MRKAIIYSSFTANLVLLLALGAIAWRSPRLHAKVRTLLRPARLPMPPAAFGNHEDFDNLPVNATPPGWSNSNGATWQVQATGGISAPNAMVLPTFTSGATVVWTGGGAEDADKGICLQFSQVVNLDADNHGAAVGIALRSDSVGSCGYRWLADFGKSQISLVRRTGGTDSSFVNFSAGISWKNGDIAVTKAQAIGSSLSFKIWKLGTEEPPTWNSVTTDNAITPGGCAGFVASAASAGNIAGACAFDDVFLGTAGSATDVFPSQILRGNTPNLYYSGCNGAGSNWAVSSKSGQMVSINPGAEIDLSAVGSSQVAIQVSTEAFDRIPTFASTSYPQIQYSVDGGPMVKYQLQPGDRILRLGKMAKSLRLWLVAMDPYGGNASFPGGSPLLRKWTGDNSLVLDGILIDSAAKTNPYAAPPGTWLAFGDSVTEGEWEMGSSVVISSAVACEDATTSHIALIADAMRCQIINCSLGGTDYTGTFDNDVPPLAHSCDWIFGGAPRHITSPPTYWSVNLGTNRRTADPIDIVDTLTHIRKMTGPGSKGIVFIPFGGQIRTVINSAYATYKASNPQDNLIVLDLNDPRYLADPGRPSAYSHDGLHPNQAAQALIAAQCVEALSEHSGGH